MDSDLTEKIRALLSDPESASKIAAVAQTLGASAPPPPPSPPPEKEAAPVFSQKPTSPMNSKHAQLMSALRAMVREDKRGKIDSMERAMTVATLFAGFRKGQRL